VVDVFKHYLTDIVSSNIVRFCRGRWVGVHVEGRDSCGRQILVRYFRGRPLRIDGVYDFLNILKGLEALKPRTIYATINMYSRIEDFGDISSLSNITACMPTWDVDNVLENWRVTLAVVDEIVRFLDGEGVGRSVIVKWSGRGCHIHIHPSAFSRDIYRRIHPLDLAYAVVEYVILKLHSRIIDIALSSDASSLRVENKIDVQRLFTAPLSLHRCLDVVCVCIDPCRILDFTPDMANPYGFKHFNDWDRYVEGEGDDLALKSFNTVGSYIKPMKSRRRKHPPLDKQILDVLSRFSSENMQ
jgi:hypothetical protein